MPTTPRDAAKFEVDDGQLLSMPLFDEEMDNMCEGCMTCNTGDNFAHAGLCKSCMTAMMDMDHKEILKGDEGVGQKLADNADVKIGALTSWKDSDGVEVEIILPMPPDVNKKDVRVKCSTTKLLVVAGDRRLLFVDPLYDQVVPDELVWCLEPAGDGTIQMQISLAKFHGGTRWGKTLCADGGEFECWKLQPIEERPADAPADEGVGAWAGPVARKKKPKFTMRDDGAEVEVNLPLPKGVCNKKELFVRATKSSLRVSLGKGGRSLIYVDPLYGDIVADELVWTLEKVKEGEECANAQITLAKLNEDLEWPSTIVKPGGTFTCWTAEDEEYATPIS